jgi:hypothetical protein
VKLAGVVPLNDEPSSDRTLADLAAWFGSDREVTFVIVDVEW